MPRVWSSEEMKLAILLGTPLPSFPPNVRDRAASEFAEVVLHSATRLCARLSQRSPPDRLYSDEASRHEWFHMQSLEPAFRGSQCSSPQQKLEHEAPSEVGVKVAMLQVKHGHQPMVKTDFHFVGGDVQLDERQR